MRSVLTTVSELVGAGLIVFGVCMVFVPAGLVVAGVFLIGLSYLVDRGSK